jgi:tRNA-2-methylthio-N6-dimethylallyladenosine synthase
VHLPVQSGSNRILRAMRRGYKIDDYLRRVDVIKNARRRLALTSDIIIGFPGETSEDFEETLTLVDRCQYDSLYIFKYSERSGTPAGKLCDNVPKQEKADRFLALENLQRDIQKRINSGYIGRELQVLVEGESVKSDRDLSGHSTCHKVVNFPADTSLIGCQVIVQVTSAKANSLYGVVRKVLSRS